MQLAEDAGRDSKGRVRFFLACIIVLSSSQRMGEFKRVWFEPSIVQNDGRADNSLIDWLLYSCLLLLTVGFLVIQGGLCSNRIDVGWQFPGMVGKCAMFAASYVQSCHQRWPPFQDLFEDPSRVYQRRFCDQTIMFRHFFEIYVTIHRSRKNLSYSLNVCTIFA